MARRDAGEFTSFVLGSQPALRRTAFLMCGDWTLASDFVQEAFIRVYRHWPRLRGDDVGRAPRSRSTRCATSAVRMTRSDRWTESS